ncbi:putative membrane protein [Candidatus Rhodobacter oscarellae]|uniref:Putative membrane protein n=1 Tax=Candidatus Rhodobacter oscarellae TaxID=1675527 RepID=A0A0J9E6Y8_9RHOB|nr:DMT family transporter [Candidatus Rhodobacter lobularis]KMW57574.1 putative membrane protein [Candidatus Rhodobacter lobularis]
MSNLRAIGLMLFSMATFAIGDALIKVASADLAVGQMVLIIASMGLVFFVALALRAGQPLYAPGFWAPPVILRNLVEACTAICMVSAISATTLSLTISIVQAVPLLVTLGAALFLGEHVGPRRWVAVAVGLLGVMIMLRPSSEGIALGALWAVGAAIGLAVRDIASRLAPPDVTNLQLAIWGTASLIPSSALFMAFTEAAPLAPGPLAITFVAAAATALGYYAITAAMRTGEVSAVAPFRYTRLLFALVLAMLFLGERPDAATLIGAAVVIASGLFVLLRERALAQTAA